MAKVPARLAVLWALPLAQGMWEGGSRALSHCPAWHPDQTDSHPASLRWTLRFHQEVKENLPTPNSLHPQLFLTLNFNPSVLSALPMGQEH